METKPAHWYRQSAAIPIRETDGHVEVLLVTTRKGHWIVPKGIIEPGLGSADSARAEAREEAGVDGSIEGPPLGRFTYEKWGGTPSVEVFVLRVHEVASAWLEDSFRTREWVSVDEAVRRVELSGLKDCLRVLPSWVQAHRPR